MRSKKHRGHLSRTSRVMIVSCLLLVDLVGVLNFPFITMPWWTFEISMILGTLLLIVLTAIWLDLVMIKKQ